MKRFFVAMLMIGFGLNVEADMVAVGDDAPKFSGVNQKGDPVSLNDYNDKWLAVYFYPKADTPGCTKQACSLRDGMADLAASNLSVLGVSVDSVDDQAKFHEKYNLTFPLLADEDGSTTAAFGVRGGLFGMAKRVTFLISPEGKIAAIITDVSVGAHAEQIRKTVKELQEK